MSTATKADSGLAALFENVAELPTLPSVVAQISRMTVSPRTNASDIGKLISNDPALSSKILKLVNSSYYGFPRRITSVTKAIVLLGFAKVKNMAISAAVVDVFRAAGDMDGFDFLQYWRHAVGCAVAGEVIARRLLPGRSDDAFVGGLLAETGKVLMAYVVPQRYAKALEHARREGVPMLEAERAVLGSDHAQAGALLAESWNFPPVLVEMIRHQAEPDGARTERPVTDVVHLAHCMVAALGILGAGEQWVPALNPGTWKNLKLEDAALLSLMDEYLRAFDSADALLELAA
jgi:HD-like signal output (HDOD) protein